MFTEISRHLDKNLKKKPSDLDKQKKYEKSYKLAEKLVSRKNKSEREVCFLFWLEICSIIGAYFILILVPKFKLKISVKTSVKTRGFLSLIFLVFFTLL